MNQFDDEIAWNAADSLFDTHLRSTFEKNASPVVHVSDPIQQHPGDHAGDFDTCVDRYKRAIQHTPQ